MDIKKILNDHKLWLNDEGGARADLTRADLTRADLTYADLTRADLTYADLTDANLRGANLTYADLTRADLTDANLTDANLRGADLTRADLTRADLRECIGDMHRVKSIQCDVWCVSYNHTHLNIGCQSHLIEEWFEFSDEKIQAMDTQALSWWTIWKPILKQIIEVSPCKP